MAINRQNQSKAQIMGDRGRKPASELSVVPIIGVERRPEPPGILTKDQEIEWVRVVERMPANWFPAETHGMLVQYCKHSSAAQRVSFLIQEMEAREFGAGDEGDYFNLDDYDKLLKMQERESRAMTALARSLRFTLQATYDKSKGKGSARKKPWESN